MKLIPKLSWSDQPKKLKFSTYLNATGICWGSVVAVAVLYAIVDSPATQLTAYAFSVAMAAFWAGGIIGFLFGVPIHAVRSTPETPDGKAANGDQQSSTRLAEVADWLTKIVIGVGLVELRSLAGWVVDAGNSLSAATTIEGDDLLFSALIVAAAATGFWFLYFWSWMYWPRLDAKMSSELGGKTVE
jgi:hypothetical protein